MRKQKWILRWKEILAVGGSFVVVPVILNYALFTWRAPQTYGDGDTWLGFWGNYSGAFVGALVALWIARKQAVEQKEILKQQLNDQNKQELAKEARNLKVVQAPALLQIQHEMRGMLKELEKADKLVSFVTNANENATKHREDREGGEELTPEEKEEAREKAIKTSAIEMKYLNDQIFSHLQSIDSLELQIKLIDCFTFYDEFSYATGYNEKRALEEFKKLTKELEEDDKKGFRTAYFDFYDKNNSRILKKIYIWSIFDSEHKIEDFREILKEIEKEIEEIREIKEEYKKAQETN
ncbi:MULTISPECIES: hypothetical protein [unclassified Bacillus cereus group]|uniref:hypothetical protein n=1 Tax=unclassified Bacillus cereus group TaxID=2750818 RepID=UPI000C34C7A8|nr:MULTISPECIES: hypothetical protein [unclassified Bacillus cereus group]MDA1588982.1 hypothetical protein [Bacillus cereus group sp. TH225LC]PKF96678.1 hypothetical protein CW365_27650 [Bacillus cereus]